MKKGIARIILGVALVVLQIMSFIGNARAGGGINLSAGSPAQFVYSLITLLSSCFFGIVGAIILISGIVARSKGETQSHQANEDTASKEASENDTDALDGFTIPLSKSLPVLFAIFAVLLILIIILS